MHPSCMSRLFPLRVRPSLRLPLRRGYGGDNVVPVQQQQQGQNFQLGLDFESPKPGFSYNGSVSQTNMDLFGALLFFIGARQNMQKMKT